MALDSRPQQIYISFVTLANLLTLCMVYVLTIPQPVMSMVPLRTHQPPPKIQPIPAISGTPHQLTLPSLGISLEVAPGQFDSNTQSWTIDENRAFYANTSVPANDTNGITLLYGHAQYGIFTGLLDMQPDTPAIVRTDNGYEFEYSYTSMREVPPTDVSVFTDQGKPQLVLQTCVGAWDSHRALYVFRFVGVRTL